MSVFNRLVISIVMLALAAGAIAIITLAWALPGESIDGLRDAVNWLDDHNQDLEKVVLTSGGAFIVLVALVVLFFEILPAQGSEVQVTDVQAGDAVLSTTAISQRIEEAVREVPQISQVRAGIRAKRKGVIVNLDLDVDPEASLAAVSDAASEATRRVLAERVHVGLLAPPHVRLHYRELRGQRGAATRPAPIAAVPPPEPEARVDEAPSPAEPAEGAGGGEKGPAER
jgi:hypothetical protein